MLFSYFKHSFCVLLIKFVANALIFLNRLSFKIIVSNKLIKIAQKKQLRTSLPNISQNSKSKKLNISVQIKTIGFFFEFLKIAVEIEAGALGENDARFLRSHGCFSIELLDIQHYK